MFKKYIQDKTYFQNGLKILIFTYVYYIRESGWSNVLKSEFYPGNLGLTTARINRRKKPHQCVFNELDLQGVFKKSKKILKNSNFTESETKLHIFRYVQYVI